MNRLNNWEHLLAEQIQRATTAAFAWGTFDCAMSVCNCILAITGTDVAAGIRGSYQDQAGAEKIIQQHGGTLEHLVVNITTEHGMPECGAHQAAPGDVVLIDNGTPGRAIGIVDLTGRFAMCASDQGLARVAAKRWLRAWNVGRP